MTTAAPGYFSPTAPGPLIPWTLRLGTAACFIGHGALGLNQTSAWTPYFSVVGIDPPHALALMPWVGAFDGAMALSVLFSPARMVVLYMAVWSVWTALLRPLAGESAWEAVERAGNYGVPLALLLCTQGGGLRAWLRAVFRERLAGSRRTLVAWTLRLTTVLVLAGHGALQWLVRKPMFCAQYDLLGLPGAVIEPWVGGFECLLALAVLLQPRRWLLLAVVAWKLATEALCPLAGSSLWVFIEHGGSYAAPLALSFLLAAEPSATPAEFPSAPKSQPQALVRH